MLQLGRGSSHSITCIKQSTLWPRSFRQVKKSSRQAVREACRPQIKQTRPTAYGIYADALHCLQHYRVNDDSPAANDSNSFHLLSSLVCWLAYFTLKSGRMFIFQRTSAEPLGLAHRTPRIRSNTIKNHWFNTCDRSTTAAAYDLCCNDLLNNFSGSLDAYWCVLVRC